MSADFMPWWNFVAAETRLPWFALLDLFLKATALLLVAHLVDALLRRRWPVACATMWNAALVGLVALPIAEFALPKTDLVARLWPSPADRNVATIVETPYLLPERVLIDDPMPETYAERPAPTIVPSPEPPIAAVVPPPVAEAPVEANVAVTAMSWSLTRRSWLLAAAAVYLIGWLIAAWRLVAALRAVAKLRRASIAPADVDWNRRLAKWIERLGLPEHVELRTSADVSVPLVVGARRPLILLPTDVAEQSKPASRDAVLVHELTHVARADYAWQLLARTVRVFLWFHPLVWLAERRINYVRERVCDAFSVHGVGGVEPYAEALLEMAGRLVRRCPLALGLAVVRTSKLGERLEAIYARGGHGRYAASRFGRASAAIAALAAAALLGHAALAGIVAREESGLPAEAAAAVEAFRAEAEEVARQTTARVEAAREQAIARLQAMQDEYTRSAKLDEAVAIRDQIRALRSLSSPPQPLHAYGTRPIVKASVAPMPDPGALLAYREFVGQSLSFLVTGDGGEIMSIWGTDVYTDDSHLAKAAVHAGVLGADETGVVRVTILPGQSSYRGSRRNGVQSLDYGSFPGSYRIEPSRNAAASGDPSEILPAPIEER
jgi:beta-lactamase regulating signal transducer with metallopeptidase domain